MHSRRISRVVRVPVLAVRRRGLHGLGGTGDSFFVSKEFRFTAAVAVIGALVAWKVKVV